MKKTVLTICVCGLMAAGSALGAWNTPFFDNFEARSLGDYPAQAVEWKPYGDGSVFDEPEVVNDKSFSGSQSLNDKPNDPSDSVRGWIDTDSMTAITAVDKVGVQFLFLRATEADGMNGKLSVGLFDGSNKVMADIYNGKVYDNKTDAEVFDYSGSVDTWYQFVMWLDWDAGNGNYGQSANVAVYDTTGGLLAQGTVAAKYDQALSEISQVEFVFGQKPPTRVRPSVYIDDLYIGSGLPNPIPEPATMGLLALGALPLVRPRRP